METQTREIKNLRRNHVNQSLILRMNNKCRLKMANSELPASACPAMGIQEGTVHSVLCDLNQQNEKIAKMISKLTSCCWSGLSIESPFINHEFVLSVAPHHAFREHSEYHRHSSEQFIPLDESCFPKNFLKLSKSYQNTRKKWPTLQHVWEDWANWSRENWGDRKQGTIKCGKTSFFRILGRRGTW